MANGTVILKKEGIVVADIVFGMGLIVDSRGSQEQFNANHLPFNGAESVGQALANRYDKTEVDNLVGGLASINGDASKVFSVATASADAHAVPKAQMDALFAQSVSPSDVLLVDGTSAELIPVLGTQPANKKYVDDTVINIGAGDMAKGVYDTNNSDIVDNSEALGNPVNLPLGKSLANQVMRLAQEAITDANSIVDMGVYVGIDVANAPANGAIIIEQFLLDGNKVQRCYSVATGLETTRHFNSSWSLWEVSDGSDRLPLTGGTMTGDLTINSPTAESLGILLRTGDQRVGRFRKSGDDSILIERFDPITEDVLTTMILTDDGNVTVNGAAPLDVNHLTRKNYVDNNFLTINLGSNDLDLMNEAGLWTDATFTNFPVGDSDQGSVMVARGKGKTTITQLYTTTTNSYFRLVGSGNNFTGVAWVALANATEVLPLTGGTVSGKVVIDNPAVEGEATLTVRNEGANEGDGGILISAFTPILKFQDNSTDSPDFDIMVNGGEMEIRATDGITDVKTTYAKIEPSLVPTLDAALTRKDYVDTKVASVPDTTGSSIGNMISLTQAEYDALTPVATTLYVIVG